MAVEIANVSLDDRTGMQTFVERWGLPIIKDETKPCVVNRCTAFHYQNSLSTFALPSVRRSGLPHFRDRRAPI